MPKTRTKTRKKPTSSRRLDKIARKLSKIGRAQKLFLLALVVALAGSAYVLISSASTDGSLDVYRLRHPGGSYLFTYNGHERDSVLAGGWGSEGTAFYAWAGAGDGRLPVYRIRLATGAYLFTTNGGERPAGVDEGIGFWAYNSPGNNRIAVHRMAAVNGSAFLFTVNQHEVNALKAQPANWRYEGVAFYTSARQSAVNNNLPTGSIDVNNCNTISGWALDGDKKDMSIQTHVYIDGKGVAPLTTTVPRGDVNQAHGATGNHGFSFAVPAIYRDSKIHTVTVYAMNVDSFGVQAGPNKILGVKKADWICDGSGKDLSQALVNYDTAVKEQAKKVEYFNAWAADVKAREDAAAALQQQEWAGAFAAARVGFSQAITSGGVSGGTSTNLPPISNQRPNSLSPNHILGGGGASNVASSRVSCYETQWIMTLGGAYYCGNSNRANPPYSLVEPPCPTGSQQYSYNSCVGVR